MNAVIITARGRNSSIPDKNLFKIMGKETLLHIFDKVRKAKKVEALYVSTDCDKITSVCEREGVKVLLRPEEVSGPDVNHGDVIRDATLTVDKLTCGTLKNVTLLLGNCIMTSGALIDLSLDILEATSEYDSVMSVWPAADDHPYRALSINEQGTLDNFMKLETLDTSRQSYPQVYYYDQGVWTFRKNCVMRQDGPTPWWWMGKQSFPIIREWVTGRDYHSKLDIDVSSWWLKEDVQDNILNIDDIKRQLKKRIK